MKDYYKTEEKFILNYKIKKDNIIIKFSNGEKRKVSKNNINLVNLVMENQVKKMSKEILLKDEKCVATKIVMWSVLAFFGVVGALALSFSSLLLCFSSIVFSVVSGVIAYENLVKLSEIDNSLKNIDFIENKEKINRELEENEKVLINSPRKVKKIVRKRKDEPSFDINNIDKLSYSQLKELLELINTYQTSSSDDYDEIKFDEDLERDNQLILKKIVQ